MANFQTHLSVAAALGAGYGAAGAWYGHLDWGPVFLGAALTALGGMLPDLDSDSGVPVRELFGDVSTERQAVRFEFESAQAAAAFYFDNFGPVVMARTRAADEAALLEDLRAMFAGHGADEGPYPGEYLMAVGRT